MSMQALNQLVARSIVDPNLVKSFAAGQVDDLLGEFEFSPEMRKQLRAIEAGSFSEFSLLAYRTVKAAEMPERRIELPSPAEGLLDDEQRLDNEQVA